MKEIDVRLLKLIFTFSEQFGVTPPQSLDIMKWWENALYEMDKETIDYLYKNYFTNSSNILKQMKVKLSERKDEMDESKGDYK